MKLIILIILFLAVILILVPSIILGIIRFIITMLGGGGTTSTSYRNTTKRNNAEDYTRFKHNETKSPDGTKKKVFDKNEGEYVSFEEIKRPADEKQN